MAGAFTGEQRLRGYSKRHGNCGEPRLRLCLSLAVLCAGLSACSSITAETGRSAYVAPGKFDVYTCSDIDERALGLTRRKEELEQLMGKASEGAGGGFVNTIAYRGEYLQARDELAELAHASADKQCAAKSQWSSGRAVF